MDIESTVLTTTRRDGRVIRSLVEAPIGADSETPLVLLVPPFSKTMRDLFTASLVMVYNGFRTWRFDHTNHVGGSDGEILDFTLASATEDLHAIGRELRHRYGRAPLGVLTSSLGSRVAFRALRDRHDVAALVSLVGVVHVQHTLKEVIGRDLVAEVLEGLPIPATAMAFEYEVSTRFIHDLIEGRWQSLDSAKEDIAACPFPIVQILGELDGWASREDAAQVIDDLPELARATYILPGASHKLEHNPSAARAALLHAVTVMRRRLWGDAVSAPEMPAIYPSFREIVNKNRQERYVERAGYPQGYRAVVRPFEDAAALRDPAHALHAGTAPPRAGVGASRTMTGTLEENP
jgi:pimeloyl-ACP methyl ester carboxylesterase